MPLLQEGRECFLSNTEWLSHIDSSHLVPQGASRKRHLERANPVHRRHARRSERRGGSWAQERMGSFTHPHSPGSVMMTSVIPVLYVCLCTLLHTNIKRRRGSSDQVLGFAGERSWPPRGLAPVPLILCLGAVYPSLSFTSHTSTPETPEAAFQISPVHWRFLIVDGARSITSDGTPCTRSQESSMRPAGLG